MDTKTTKRQWTGFLLMVLGGFAIFVLGTGIVILLYAKSCGC
jgi:hypothetical protein